LWESLGVFDLSTGVPTVELTDNGSGTIVADGVLFVSVPMGDPSGRLGDMDNDGDVDFDDIAPFVQGMGDPVGYFAQYGISPVRHGDLDRNGGLDYDDIPGFVALLRPAESDVDTALSSAADSLPEESVSRSVPYTVDMRAPSLSYDHGEVNDLLLSTPRNRTMSPADSDEASPMNETEQAGLTGGLNRSYPVSEQRVQYRHRTVRRDDGTNTREIDATVRLEWDEMVDTVFAKEKRWNDSAP
jgi:hypothetical protein